MMEWTRMDMRDVANMPLKVATSSKGAGFWGWEGNPSQGMDFIGQLLILHGPHGLHLCRKG